MRTLTAIITVWLAMAGGIGLAATIFAPDALALPACQFEDGNPDGQPCQWTDPDTGRSYYVSSEAYR